MYRRDAVRLMGAVLALPFLPHNTDAAIQLAERLHGRTDEPFRTFDSGQQALVTQIAELIIPQTDTPGATAVKVPQFIDLIASEWMGDEEKATFLAGLKDIDARAAAIAVQQQGGGGRAAKFVELPAANQAELLTALDAARNEKSGAGHAFGRLKALTVYGYFTSKIVDEQILKTQMFFSAYQGDVPFTPAV